MSRVRPSARTHSTHTHSLTHSLTQSVTYSRIRCITRVSTHSLTLTSGQVAHDNRKGRVDGDVAQKQCAQQQVAIFAQWVNFLGVYGVVAVGIRIDDDLVFGHTKPQKQIKMFLAFERIKKEKEKKRKEKKRKEKKREGEGEGEGEER